MRLRKLAASVVVALMTGTAAAEDGKFKQEQFETKTTGVIELSVEKHSPIYAEFEKSEELTKRLRALLASQGFGTVDDRSAAKSELVMTGDLRLMGGPQYYKGLTVPIGEATEKALKAGELKGQVTRGDVVGTAADLALGKAGYVSSMTSFMKGLNLSFMVAALGEATGFAGKLNQAMGLDPRGVCLSKCETWKLVEQTVLSRSMLKDATGEKAVRTMTKITSERVAPEEVIEASVAKLLENIKVVGAGAPLVLKGD
jgi:hypothetical protein